MINPKFNGLSYDFSSIDFGPLGGQLTQFLTEVTYGDEVTVGVLMGASGMTLNTTRGTYKANLSVSMYTEAFVQYWIPYVGEAGSEKKLPISFSFYNIGTPVYNVYCDSCRFLGADENYRQGETGGMISRLKFSTDLILRNNICIFRRF